MGLAIPNGWTCLIAPPGKFPRDQNDLSGQSGGENAMVGYSKKVFCQTGA